MECSNNKMQELADLIGVKLGEYFTLKFSDKNHSSNLDEYVCQNDDPSKKNIYCIDKYGFRCKTEDDIRYTYWALTWLLRGALTVEKSGFVSGDTYYVPTITGDNTYNDFYWGLDPEYDHIVNSAGLACHTVEEAVKIRKIMLDAVRKYRNDQYDKQQKE